MTGIGPGDLLADDDFFDALVEVHRERAGTGYVPVELAAATLEVLHGLYRLTFAANSRPGSALPPELEVPRPWLPKVDEATKWVEARPNRRIMTVAQIMAAGGMGG
jgi:hypothetical protein